MLYCFHAYLSVNKCIYVSCFREDLLGNQVTVLIELFALKICTGMIFFSLTIKTYHDIYVLTLDIVLLYFVY